MSGATCYEDTVKCPNCENDYICEKVIIYSDKDREVMVYQCPRCKEIKNGKRKNGSW
jgi:uncharacterized C2H2 Zn-finger protein